MEDDTEQLHIRGLNVLLVPNLGLLSRAEADEQGLDPGDCAYEDAPCQGCVFNNPLFERHMEPHSCTVQTERARECGETVYHVRRIYILPEMLDAYKARYAYQRLSRS